MRGSAVVEVAGQPVYAVIVDHEYGVRICCQTAEWDTLGLHPGVIVEVRTPGRETTPYLLSEVIPADPEADGGSTWVSFVVPVVSRHRKRA